MNFDLVARLPDRLDARLLLKKIDTAKGTWTSPHAEQRNYLAAGGFIFSI